MGIHIGLLLFIAACGTITQGTWHSKQPYVSKYFDFILQISIIKQELTSLIQTTKCLQRDLIKVYAGCQLKQNTKSSLDIYYTNSLAPRFCGAIGYTRELPVQRTWMLRRLHYLIGIKLSVLHLELPFFDLQVDCLFANITINVHGGYALCGKKSGVVFYSRYDITVRFNQGVHLGKEFGFTAVYSAYDRQAVPQIIYPQVYLVRRRYDLRYTSPFYENFHKEKAYAWHFVTLPYNRICFDRLIPKPSIIHDGPWLKSPLLHGVCTSGHCAYIVQDSKYLTLEYKAVTHSTFQMNTSLTIHIESPTVSNKVFAYRVTGIATALVVKYLNITYVGVIGHSVDKCQYGGVFVYSSTPRRDNTSRYVREVNFCQTHSDKEFTMQLSDKSGKTYYLFVIMYAGYNEGQIHAIIFPRDCRIKLLGSTIDSGACNNFQLYMLMHSKYELFLHPETLFDVNVFGPTSFMLQIISPMYHLAKYYSISVTGTDRDVLTLKQHSVTVNNSDYMQVDFDNLENMRIRYETRELAYALILTEVRNRFIKSGAMCFGGIRNVYTFSRLGLPLNIFLSSALLTGSEIYKIYGISQSPIYSGLVIDYQDGSCPKICTMFVTVNVTEYVARKKYFIELESSAYLPFYWINTMSKGSGVVIFQHPKECRDCVLEVTVGQHWWFRAMDLTRTKEILPRGFTSWNEADAQCQQQGKRLLEPSHDRDYVSFLQNAIDHIENTGLPFPYALMLGAYKNANEDQFEFVSGRHITDGYFNTKMPYTVKTRNLPAEWQPFYEYVSLLEYDTEEAACIVFVPSYSLAYHQWEAIPCNMSIEAVYICEDILSRMLSPNEIFHSNYTTAFTRRVNEQNISIVESPSVTCPYPWVAAERRCIYLLEVKKPDELSVHWQDMQCSSINASVYDIDMFNPMAYDIDTAELIEMQIVFNKLHEMNNLNYTLISMSRVQYNECYFQSIGEEDCRLFDGDSFSSLQYVPDIWLVACTKMFDEYRIEGVNMKTFQCKYGNLIPLVYQCDGIQQCLSGDDEHMCDDVKKSPMDCSPLSLSAHKNNLCSSWCSSLFVPCSDGKCIPLDSVCNGYVDCKDGWDEHICDKSSVQLSSIQKQIISHLTENTFHCKDGNVFNEKDLCTVDFTEHSALKGCDDLSHVQNCWSFGCPYAFKCRSFACVALSHVCDGVIDCRYGDDEVACENFVCTGLLQCRESNVCVPPWEVCDGRVHCLPYGEDEVYCEDCPPGLLCHGLAAQCDNLSMLHTLPASLKALICPHQVQLHHILRPLISHLAHALILEVIDTELSDEDFENYVGNLPNLVLFSAMHNDVTNLDITIEKTFHSLLRVLNLAHNNIKVLKYFQFQIFSKLQILILHNNHIITIQTNAFYGLESLFAIDLTENELAVVLDIPGRSPVLYWVESDLMYLCCLLSAVEKCFPTASAFSTCKNLLHSNVHRVIIYGQALGTLLTNLVVIIFHNFLFRKEARQIIHLTVGNLCMSCYLILIAAVDTYYRNRFDIIAVSWKHSVVCKGAASLNFMGSEISLSMLLYISVFRAYSIHSMYKDISAHTTWIVCLFIWAIWVSYVVGLSFVTSVQHLEAANNICIYVFFDAVSESKLLQVHSSIFVIVNIFLLALLFGFNAFIFWSVTSVGESAVISKKLAQKRRQAVSVRMSAILVFTALCWLPLLLCQMISLFGLNLPAAVPVWMAILIIPINAYFSPVMFGIIPIVRRNKRKLGV